MPDSTPRDKIAEVTTRDEEMTFDFQGLPEELKIMVVKELVPMEDHGHKPFYEIGPKKACDFPLRQAYKDRVCECLNCEPRRYSHFHDVVRHPAWSTPVISDYIRAYYKKTGEFGYTTLVSENDSTSCVLNDFMMLFGVASGPQKDEYSIKFLTVSHIWNLSLNDSLRSEGILTFPEAKRFLMIKGAQSSWEYAEIIWDLKRDLTDLIPIFFVLRHYQANLLLKFSPASEAYRPFLEHLHELCRNAQAALGEDGQPNLWWRYEVAPPTKTLDPGCEAIFNDEQLKYIYIKALVEENRMYHEHVKHLKSIVKKSDTEDEKYECLHPEFPIGQLEMEVDFRSHGT